MFRELGFAPTSVGMQYVSRLIFFRAQHNTCRRISFGKGEDFWSNVFPTELTAQFSSDIKKFGRVLKIIKKLEVLFAVMPVNKMLPLFRFSKDFGEKMVYPLVALFFGTGNQTPYISCAILVRTSRSLWTASDLPAIIRRSVCLWIPACDCSNLTKRVYLPAYRRCMPSQKFVPYRPFSSLAKRLM